MELRKVALVGLMTALSSFALVACGDKEEDGPATQRWGGGAAAEDDGDAGETRPFTEENGEDDTPEARWGRDSKPSPTKKPRTDGLKVLQAVSHDLQNGTYKLVYGIEGSDHEAGKLDGTLTLASKDEKQLFGVEGKLGSDNGAFVVILDGPSAYLCVEGQGDSACLKVPSNEQAPLPLPSVLSIDDVLKRVAEAPETTVTEVDGETIAGRDGRCFDVASPEGNGRVCLDEGDGLVLLLDGEFGGTHGRLELREYTDNPAASEFEPPYAVTELP